jgi:hypothetical protein
MLVVKCPERLAEVRAYADSIGERDQLEEQLAYLAEFRGGECVCELQTDFAPYSFYFVLYGPVGPTGEREVWMNGGLIHHAAHSNGVGGPEYSVTLTPQSRPHWSVHT